jgi:hypothetical protein
VNLTNPVGRLGADSEVSGGGGWRSMVRSYPEGRAKGWPHADDSFPGKTDRASHGRGERRKRPGHGRRLTGFNNRGDAVGNMMYVNYNYSF